MRRLSLWLSFAAVIGVLAVPALAVCPTAAPVIVEPANGAGVSPGQITLRWTTVANAGTYEVFASKDGSQMFSIGGPTFDDHRIVNIDAGRDINWYVTVHAPNCADLSSDVAYFYTTCPTDRPSLLGPPRGATFTAGSSVRFEWSAVPGAVSYDVQVTPDFGQSFQTLVENTTRTDFTTAMPAGDWGWTVRANFDSCPPNYAEPSHFLVSGGASCNNNTAPPLLSPADNATVEEPLILEWGSAPNANGYRVFLQAEGARTPELVDDTTGTETAVSGLAPGKYKWWVAADYDNCPGVESPKRTVTIIDTTTSECPANPGKATLLAPANNAAALTSPVTFRWSAVPNASAYRVIVFTNGETIDLETTDQTSISTELPAGTGAWAVQTFFGDDCPTTLSERFVFTVSQGASCDGNAAPQLLSPATGATGVASPVELRWSDVPKAINYRVYAAAGDGDFEFYGDTDTNSLTVFVPAGVVKWFVVAEFAACPDVRSAIGAFRVATETEQCPEAEIALQSPAEGASVSSPVHVAWSAVANATAYRVYVSLDGGAPFNIARTTATHADLNLPAGAITWRVEALREDCPSVLSDDGHFTVQNGASCSGKPAPTLVAPLGGEENPPQVTSPVTLRWNVAEGASAYRVWLAEEGAAFADVALTKDNHVSLTLDDPGHYRWFVEALYEGCRPVASTIAHFVIGETAPRCNTAAPSLISPPQGSTSTSPVTFVWTAVEGAERYRLFVSIDGAEPQLIGATDDTELTRVLPPGVVDWSVEAVFESCPSTFATRARFTIPRSQNCPTAAPQPLAPANGAVAQPGSIEFTWNPLSGAVKYAVIVKVDDGSPTVVGTTSDTHLSQKIPPGTIEWRVIAFFAGCDPIESETLTFEVTPSDCNRIKPVLLLPDADDPPAPSPVRFRWSEVPQATSYTVWAWQGDATPNIIASTKEPAAVVTLKPGAYHWYVEAQLPSCPSAESAVSDFRVAEPEPCGTPSRPIANVVGQAASNTKYRVSWSPLANVGLYELQEATKLDFSDAVTFTTDDNSRRFQHEVTSGAKQYLYRVRGVSNCSDARGPYSDVVGVFVVAPVSNNSSTELGSGDTILQKIFLPGTSTPLHFAVTADRPWITVTPSSGTLPPEGITLTVSADSRALALGTNTGTIKVSYSSAAGARVQTNATTISSVPISVSLVTPVAPAGKGAPRPDALIFPVVGHAAGVNGSLFESDIRVTNLGAQTMKYQVNFTPSGVDGTVNGSSTSIEIAPNATVALDDIVSSVFGTGTISSAVGMLEVRPLTTTSSTTTGGLFSSITSSIKPLTTAASSRTYNFTPNGTFGQFIPATRFADFIGRATSGPSPILSLQQVSQSAAYRANFGFAEASGQAADLTVRVFDAASQLIATIPVSLQAGEHRQLNGMLSDNGINDLANGRVEVEVTGGNGKVTAYVSEIDNRTNDPLLVSAVVKGAVSANRFVVPGTAYLNTGAAFWVTDLRVFNAGAATDATVTFYPQGNPDAKVEKTIRLDAGEIEALDNVLGSFFGQPNGAGGMIAVTTPQNAQLTATARTYNQTANGTYGQFIPGVTPAQSIGANDRALQILQLEQSPRIRTNIGLAETSGAPVSVEVTAIVPDSLASPVVRYDLAANEFRQFSLNDFNFGTAVYNARVSVKVVGGSGRVTAYGSAIDEITQDPTYVPAQ
ncbi:MAG TPA: hypothetical protein VF824_00335 [Thermoanaerobaculia bacterium]|jgi:hypothetical protein